MGVDIKDILSLVSAIIGPRERIYLGIVGGLVVGVFVGLVILGWGIAPLQWKDAAPVDLHSGYRQIYIESVARIYEMDGNTDNARRMLGGDSWSDNKLARDLNQAVKETTDSVIQTRLANLGMALLGVDVRNDDVLKDEGGGSSLCTGILLIAFIVLVAAAGIMLLTRLRQRGQPAPAGVGGDPDKVEAALTRWAEEEAPVAQFVTSYAFGDDLYNPDFGIETATGGFMGSCGVGMAELIGVGEPKRVTAFDIWLFDTNPPTTVTKVLMSEHCYHDSGLRDKLAPKGDPVLGYEGAVIILETSSLRVQAKVLEIEYGTEDLPPNSFVARLTIELAVWQMGEGGGLSLASA
jgi:hypothetical protein